jgi:hypothetical protein
VRTRIFLLVVVTTLLAPATAASAKGPAAATVDGDGYEAPVALDLDGHWALVEDLGFFATVFRTEPDPTLDGAPAGDLGPRLVVSWEVPGPGGDVDVVRQDVYPYAEAGPVTYLAPGQAVMGQRSYGGWFAAPAGLADDLVAAGLPAPRAAATAPADAGPAGSGPARSGVLVGAVVAAALVGAGLVVAGRRARSATA